MGTFKSLLTLALLAITIRSAFGWNYTNQNWGGHCDGSRQSPINLEHKKAHPMHEESLHWNNNATAFGEVLVKNSGHGFSVSGGGIGRLVLHRGGLKGEYRLAQFHYHWGPNYDGSEHRLEGKQTAAELHLVHVHERFGGNISAALGSGDSDALAVVGVMLRQKMREPAGHEQILMKAVANTRWAGEKTTVDMGKTTVHHLLPHDLTHFYRYEGSLTTPTCNEQVIWTVLKEDVSIPRSMIERFMEIDDKDGNSLKNTARYEQALNGRKVHFNEHKPKPAPDSASSLSPFVLTLAAAAVAAIATV
jgi:carbonic anhydrase